MSISLGLCLFESTKLRLTIKSHRENDYKYSFEMWFERCHDRKLTGYFNNVLPAYLKKNEESMPCAALLNMRSIVAFECPSSMLKLLDPANIQDEFQF